MSSSSLLLFGLRDVFGVISDKSIHCVRFGVRAETGVISLRLEDRFRFEPIAIVGLISIQSKISLPLSLSLLLLSIVIP